ncbi:hypothetical protein SO3561_06294 [Streptomyces olivochromogenes]|uniref:Phage protein n=1 Tax=Streptomyces olivochromogenes TaxID=1963 RepID=A0A250VKS3_STROL|nr:hypothetical protein SO3561_06294 [Streptomyces olivochromogenes]
MIFRCNTRVTILGSTTSVDEWGDLIDNDSVVASGIPASLTEVANTAYSENSTRPRVIRGGICRLSSAHANQVTDNVRIRDEKTGFTWIVLSVTLPNDATGHMPMHIQVERS